MTDPLAVTGKHICQCQRRRTFTAVVDLARVDVCLRQLTSHPVKHISIYRRVVVFLNTPLPFLSKGFVAEQVKMHPTHPLLLIHTDVHGNVQVVRLLSSVISVKSSSLIASSTSVCELSTAQDLIFVRR